jgi:hypothetical protein
MTSIATSLFMPPIGSVQALVVAPASGFGAALATPVAATSGIAAAPRAISLPDPATTAALMVSEKQLPAQITAFGVPLAAPVRATPEASPPAMPAAAKLTTASALPAILVVKSPVPVAAPVPAVVAQPSTAVATKADWPIIPVPEQAVVPAPRGNAPEPEPAIAVPAKLRTIDALPVILVDRSPPAPTAPRIEAAAAPPATLVAAAAPPSRALPPRPTREALSAAAGAPPAAAPRVLSAPAFAPDILLDGPEPAPESPVELPVEAAAVAQPRPVPQIRSEAPVTALPPAPKQPLVAGLVPEPPVAKALPAATPPGVIAAAAVFEIEAPTAAPVAKPKQMTAKTIDRVAPAEPAAPAAPVMPAELVAAPLSAVSPAKTEPSHGGKPAAELPEPEPVLAEVTLPVPVTLMPASQPRVADSAPAPADDHTGVATASASPAALPATLAEVPSPTADFVPAAPAIADTPAPAAQPVLSSDTLQPVAMLEPASQRQAAVPVLPTAIEPQEPVVSARTGSIGREMGIVIARHAATGGGEAITVRLDPVDMGRIEVRLTFSEDGQLRAVVAADNPAALDLLRRDSADLNRALADAGVRSDQHSLRFDTRAGSGDQPGGQGSQNRRDPVVPIRIPAVTEPVDVGQEDHPRGMNGRIDMMA